MGTAALCILALTMTLALFQVEAAAPAHALPSCRSTSFSTEYWDYSVQASSTSTYAFGVSLKGGARSNNVDLVVAASVNGYGSSYQYRKTDYPGDYGFHGSFRQYQRTGRGSTYYYLKPGDRVSVIITVNWRDNFGVGHGSSSVHSCVMP